MGPRRMEQHGVLMLEALTPLRPQLLAARRRAAAVAGDAQDRPKKGAGKAVVGAHGNADEGATPSSMKKAADELGMVVAARRKGSGTGGDHGQQRCTPRNDKATDAKPRRSSRFRAAGAAEDVTGAADNPGGDAAGDGTGAPHSDWLRMADVMPQGPWHERRAWCAAVRGCRACREYSEAGEAFGWAHKSQSVLGMLASERAYGSHEKAVAAGWRWNASPNHNAHSHDHQWWPPQQVADEYEASAKGQALKLPLGTYKAIALIQWLFEE